MGQKCSCFDKEMDSKTEKNIYDMSKFNRKESEYMDNDARKIVKAKNSHLINREDLINDENNMGLNFYDNEFDREKISSKIQVIIRNISSWFHRKKFRENLRNSLVQNSEEIFNELFSSEAIKKLIDVNKKIEKSFDLEGWKEFYNTFPLKFEDLPLSRFSKKLESNNEKNLSNLIINNQYEEIFGETFAKKIILMKPQKSEEIKFKQNSSNNKENKERDYSFIYKGQVNKFGEKHGRGILYYLDGSSMEEGFWFNDQLVGWCRKVLPNGIYIECKQIYYF